MAICPLQVWRTHPLKGSLWPEELEPWATWDICQIWLAHGLRPQGNYVDKHCSRESLTLFFFCEYAAGGNIPNTKGQGNELLFGYVNCLPLTPFLHAHLFDLGEGVRIEACKSCLYLINAEKLELLNTFSWLLPV